MIAHGHATKAILRENSQAKCRRPRLRPTFCVSLRNPNALGHVTRAILCENLQEKCRRPHLRPTFCASLRNRNALGHVKKASLCENLQVKCIKMPETLRFACAIEMCLNMLGHVRRAILCENDQVKCCRPRPRPTLCARLRMSQEPYYARIYREHTQSKCTSWAKHKSHCHFMRELTGKNRSQIEID